MTINQEIVAAVQLSVDGKGFKRVGNAHSPWDSTTDFLNTIPMTRRHDGMFGYIRNGANIEIWHFVGGITDDKLVKYGLETVTSVVQTNTSTDFPPIGSDGVIYISKDTWTSYVWDGSGYRVFGNTGPAGAKGDTGDIGPSVSLEIGTVTSGDVASATITGTSPDLLLNLVLPVGATGADGNPTITVRTNGVNNPIQDVLDIIDSDTVGVKYLDNGRIQLYTLSPVLVNVKAGTSEAIAAGITVGAVSYTNSKLAGRESETYRSGALISDFDQGSGVEYAIKDTDGTLNSDTINLLSPIYEGEWIRIKLV